MGQRNLSSADEGAVSEGSHLKNKIATNFGTIMESGAEVEHTEHEVIGSELTTNSKLSASFQCMMHLASHKSVV